MMISYSIHLVPFPMSTPCCRVLLLVPTCPRLHTLSSLAYFIVNGRLFSFFYRTLCLLFSLIFLVYFQLLEFLLPQVSAVCFRVVGVQHSFEVFSPSFDLLVCLCPDI